MLVSVQTPAEAAIVAASDGVTVVDVKDPSQGSLGFAGAAATNDIAAAVGRTRPDGQRAGNAADKKLVSVALGELHDLDLEEVNRIDWAHVDFVKIGLSGFYEDQRWRSLLGDAFATIPPSVRRVLVLYVDQVEPAVAKGLVESASADGLSVALLDTFDKSQGNIFAHWSDDDVASVFRTAAQLSLTTVLAGSIGLGDLDRAFQTGANLIGVRGAVCDGDRSGNLSKQRLNQLLSAYRDTTQAPTRQRVVPRSC